MSTSIRTVHRCQEEKSGETHEMAANGQRTTRPGGTSTLRDALQQMKSMRQLSVPAEKGLIEKANRASVQSDTL